MTRGEVVVNTKEYQDHQTLQEAQLQENWTIQNRGENRNQCL